MFEKTKQFVKDHKGEIIVGAIVGTIGIAVGLTIGLETNKKFVEIGKNYWGKEVISWSPAKGCMTLERVKEFLDLNAENNAQFAIFREGTNPGAYLGIITGGEPVFPENPVLRAYALSLSSRKKLRL